jgi:hypothetical protein
MAMAITMHKSDSKIECRSTPGMFMVESASLDMSSGNHVNDEEEENAKEEKAYTSGLETPRGTAE